MDHSDKQSETRKPGAGQAGGNGAVGKHTPGDWTRDELDEIDLKSTKARNRTVGIYAGTDADGDDIQIGRFVGENAEANAQLAIASPDLLAACVHALGCIENEDGDPREMLRAAIAKAEGRA